MLTEYTMLPVLYTAFGVGGATVIGAALGFVFKNYPIRAKNILVSFAAGVMLAASVIGLIIPAADEIDAVLFPIVIIGIFLGGVAVRYLDGMIPQLRRIAGVELECDRNAEEINRVLLFVAAIAIHNFPEGIAAGVGFGCGDLGEAVTVVSGIMIQNLPEGMIVVAPMLSAGISRKRTFLCAVASGGVEVIGTLLGYFSVSFFSAVLPFALAFAGGTMLYVISDEMIPDARRGDDCSAATFSLLLGFAVMLAIDFFI